MHSPFLSFVFLYDIILPIILSIRYNILLIYISFFRSF